MKVLQGRAVTEVAERARMTAATKTTAIATRAMRDEKLELEEKMGRDIGVRKKKKRGMGKDKKIMQKKRKTKVVWCEFPMV